MIGAWVLSGSCASGTRFAALLSLGIHWMAPAGLRVCTQSNLNRLSRYCVVQPTGLDVHAPSSPLVTVSPALPLPHLFFQPKPCASTASAAGSTPTHFAGS